MDVFLIEDDDLKELKDEELFSMIKKLTYVANIANIRGPYLLLKSLLIFLLIFLPMFLAKDKNP